LDLDALFGGFQPLFEALTPDQVNRLSGDLVNALQGEGGTVTVLLRDIADFTLTLADRDAVIGQVVSNLNLVLGTVTDHSSDFAAALDQAQLLVSGLAADRKQIEAGLVATGDLAEELTVTLRQVRPDLVKTADEVKRLGALLNTPVNSARLNQTLAQLPPAYLRMAGAGSYGSFFNFYLCGLGAKYTTLTGGTGSLPQAVLGESRCK
jgi:phospholipid/cholesterol/gamma-HCH transport system substrate-binding protein